MTMTACPPQRTQKRARNRIGAIGVVLGLVLIASGVPAAAHEDIVGSEPPSGTAVDGSITEVSIEFGTPISDDIEMSLWAPGEDNLIEDTTTTRTSETTAKIEFDQPEEEGLYIVRYLTTAALDGHFLVGAVSFVYGSGGSGSSSVPWLLFALPMIAILAVGTAFSYRLHKKQTAAQG